MKQLGLILTLILMSTLSFGEETVMEARVFYQNPDVLLQTMGDLLGRLDICTVKENPAGGYYLLINTTQSQLDQIRAKGFRTEITYQDVADKLWQMIGKRDPQLLRDFGLFYTYWEMRDSVNAFASRYPAICKKDSLGRSYQGLALLSLKISDNVAADEGEPAMCINGATHAREPMGTHLCIDFAQWLLYNYGTDSLATWLVNNRQIYIIPVMNPDGYRYNSDSGGATSNIRKNRHLYSGQGTSSAGVDLNRNYGYKWGWDNNGSSPYVTDLTYRGPYRFSEIETQQARDYFLPKKIRTQNDYHSYGPYNLCVWGYSTNNEPIPDSITVREMLDSMRAKNGYPAASTGPISRVLYLANGGSCEWETKDTLQNGVQKFSTLTVSIEANQTDFWDGWNNQTVINTNITQCRPINIYFAKIAGVYFDNLQMMVADTALGNHTCQLDPNENSHMWFFLRNRAVHPLDSAYSVSGNLVSLDTQVTVTDPTASFPKIYRKATGNNSADRFQVHCSPNAVPGTYKKFRLVMTFKDDTCTITQALRCSLVVGNNPVGVAEPGIPVQPLPRLSVVQNPARSTVHFQASGLAAGDCELAIYNATGRLVDRLTMPARLGAWKYDWHAQAEPGVYFYRFSDPSHILIGKFVLVE
jgi:hypothetical protein